MPVDRRARPGAGRASATHSVGRRTQPSAQIRNFGHNAPMEASLTIGAANIHRYAELSDLIQIMEYQ